MEQFPRSNNSGAVVTLANPNVLDCPICIEPLFPPVFQCASGHLACHSCCTKLRRCPRCSKLFGLNRNRAIESVLGSAITSCVNMENGCQERISYLKRLEHEKTCYYAPISCPRPGCKYTGVPKCFYSHFTEEHAFYFKPIGLNTVKSIYMAKDEKHVLLQEKDEKILFVLRRIIDHPLGSFVNICVAPNASSSRFSCDITAKEGHKSTNMKTYVELTARYSSLPAKDKCLLVTNDFHVHNSTGLYLDIVISKLS